MPTIAPTTDLSDDELVADAQDGSEAAWRELVRRHRPRVLRWLQVRRSFEREKAEDLTQKAFLRLYKHLHRYDPDGSFGGWLMRSAQNLAKNHHRDVKREPFVRAEMLAGDDEAGSWLERREADPTHRFDPEADLELVELTETVEDAISELPPHQRKTIQLRRQGFNYADIAEKTDTPIGTVKSRLARARRSLRSALKERGVEVEEVVAT